MSWWIDHYISICHFKNFCYGFFEVVFTLKGIKFVFRLWNRGKDTSYAQPSGISFTPGINIWFSFCFQVQILTFGILWCYIVITCKLPEHSFFYKFFWPDYVTIDFKYMYLADSESSSIRRVDMTTGGSKLLAGGDPTFSDNLFQVSFVTKWSETIIRT